MAARFLCSSTLEATLNSHLCIRSEKPRCITSSTCALPAQLQKHRAVCAFHARRLHGRKLSIVRALDEDSNGDGGADEPNKGRQLWRTELLSNEFDSIDDEVSQSATLSRDIERLSKKEEVERLLSRAAGGSSSRSRNDGALDRRGGGIRDIVDKVLVADFFFILFILAWLLAGLAERAALESTSLIDSWLPLWPSVFQPALGVFMAGAIVSALSRRKE